MDVKISRVLTVRKKWRSLRWFCLGGIMALGYFFSLKMTTFVEFMPCDPHLDEERLQGPLDDHDPMIIDYLKAKYILPPSAQDYNLSTDPFYKKMAVGYSWSFVHNILKTLFKEEHSKFFVEAGGFDGEYLSNTLWLERTRSWTGLLVEPQRKRFQEMIYKRRKCWITNACLAINSYPHSAVMISMETKENETHLDPNIIRASTHDLLTLGNGDPYADIEMKIKKENFTSQCFPLYSFLLALDITVVDFLSLDLEGTEAEVFNTIPLDKIRIRTVVVENYAEDFDHALIKWMNRKGFQILDVGGAPDYFFVNVNEIELIKRYRKTHTYFQDIINKKIDIKVFF